MTEPESFEIVLEGSGRLTDALARMLREEGLLVQYDPPLEHRSIGADTHTVVVDLVVLATAGAGKAALDKALAKFRERFPGVKVRGRHERP